MQRRKLKAGASDARRGVRGSAARGVGMKRSNGLTIRDVAKEAGVSLGTVSRVLNQHETVSADIRQRVERAIRSLGYTPNAVAQSMRNQHTRTVGCIIRDINLPALAAFVRAAHDVLFQAGYALLLTNSEGQRDREMELVVAAQQPEGRRAHHRPSLRAGRAAARMLQSTNIPSSSSTANTRRGPTR